MESFGKEPIHREDPSPATPQPKLGISPAKTQRPQRKLDRFPNLAFLASWRAQYLNPRILISGRFTQAAQNLKYSNTKDMKVSDD
jgi:hypothetical protein